MRHRLKNKKLNRTSGHRKALFKNLLSSLILNNEVTTTEAKAKVIKRLADKLITKAKAGTLHSRRLVHAYFNNKTVTNTLVDQLVPQMNERTSGFTRLTRLGYRSGDNSMMAKLSFSDSIVVAQPVKKSDSPVAETKQTKK